MLLARTVRVLAVLLASCWLAAPSGAQTTHIVEGTGFVFVPKNLDITIGDTVEWHRLDGVHTITEGLGPFPDGSEYFDAPFNGANPIFSVTFDAAFVAANPPNAADIYDYYCVPHFSNGMTGRIRVNEPVDPWTDLGGGLAGVSGVPVLAGTGSLQGGTNATLELIGAAPNALANLFLSLADTPVPFKCGVLSTVPVALSLPLVTSPAGGILIPFSPWPTGLPSGVALYWQYAVQDGAAICGVSISNLLEATLP